MDICGGGGGIIWPVTVAVHSMFSMWQVLYQKQVLLFHYSVKQSCGIVTDKKMEAERRSEDLSPKPQSVCPTAYLTSPLGCPIVLSDLTCPKVSSCDFSLQPTLPATIPISIMAPSFQLFRPPESLHLLFLVPLASDGSRNPASSTPHNMGRI